MQLFLCVLVWYMNLVETQYTTKSLVKVERVEPILVSLDFCTISGTITGQYPT